ncbi:MAG: 50S ribosomal protein L9 [Sphaerochaetaceae bacterium]|jgi:large subunit ribosomal protein L9|nr:50S ribosomal protein L9 [Sphaerochaetaceae bacterium]MDD3942663.1 50S ribosomal protein L9 [Sphaerochaetaceae bacterium]MDX9939863.1 50S ribosomal protein L9 [Sphaerochaetaceae bacterium]
MKIILNQDVHNLGEEGDIVVVKDGYARNYLLPKGFAVLFNKANQALFASRAATIEKRKEEKRKAAASVKDRLDQMTLTLVVSAGDSGKLFGSVTNTMVQEALAKEGIDVERKRIEVASHEIKMVGNYSVKVRLYEGESAHVKIVVLSETVVKKAEAEKAAAEKAAAKAAAAEAKKTAEVETPVVVEEVYGAEGEDEADTDDEE